MAQHKLTKKFIDSLKAPATGTVHYYDKELQGFVVSVHPSGKKSFGIRYGTRNRRRWMSLGLYGVLTVDEARDGARRLLSEATLGGDPAVRKQKRGAEQIPTFEKWAADYLAERQRTKKRPDLIAYHLAKATAVWKHRQIDTIEPADVSLVFLTMRKTPINANRWLATVSACFGAAVKARILKENPAAGIEANRENPARARVLDDQELARLGAAIDAEPDVHTRAAFRLLLETGARLREVLHARWSDVDLEGCLWRLPNPKAGKPQIIVLAETTAAWLKDLPRVKGSPFVIPAADPEKARYDLKGPWERIKAAAGIEDATIHDIRRTFGKLVTRTAGLHMASVLLRHSDPRITAAVYAPQAETEMRSAVAAVLPFMRRTA